MLKKIVIAMIVLIALGTPLGLHFAGIITLPLPAALGGESAAEDEDVALDAHGQPIGAASVYLTLDPPFIVNFVHRGSLRYLQLSLELMYHDQVIIDQIRTQMPEVRNDLILLFSSQDFETLSTLEGKERLRNDVLLAVNNVLQVDPYNPGPAAGGAVYITNFVMQ
jgi:flagellar protein FliL